MILGSESDVIPQRIPCHPPPVDDGSEEGWPWQARKTRADSVSNRGREVPQLGVAAREDAG